MTRFIKVYKIILWVVLVMITVPLMGASFFNRPTADDVTSLMLVKQVAQESGTVFSVLKNAATSAYDFWITITGTFSSKFFSFIAWYTFSNTLSQIYPVFLLIFIIYSCFQAARCLRVVKQTISNDTVTCFALLLSIMYILLIPNIFEGVFWFSGSTYTFSFAVSVCAFSSLFRRCWQNKKNTLKDSVYLFLFCLLFFFMGGGDHLNATCSVVLYGYLAIWILMTGKPKRYLIPLLFLVVGYLLAVFAPGNTVRQEVTGVHLPIGIAALSSFIQSFQFIFHDVRYWVFLLLFLPLILDVSAEFSVSLTQVCIVALASIAVLTACYFPNVWSTYSITPRHINLYFYITCILLVVNAIILSSYIKQCRKTPSNVVALSNPTPYATKPMTIGLCVVVFILSVLFVPSLQFTPLRLNCTIPSVKSVSNILDGQLKQYAEDYDNLVALLSTHPSELVIGYCPHNGLLGTPDLVGDPLAWKNIDFAKYYGENGSSISCY